MNTNVVLKETNAFMKQKFLNALTWLKPQQLKFPPSPLNFLSEHSFTMLLLHLIQKMLAIWLDNGWTINQRINMIE